MKALSIRQPWAWLILNAGKIIENRTWPTNFRGSFLVHAAAGMTRSEWEGAMAFVENNFGAAIALTAPRFEELERGGIVGIVDMVACVTVSESRWFMGPCGFELENPRPLPFYPMKGRSDFRRDSLTICYRNTSRHQITLLGG